MATICGTITETANMTDETGDIFTPLVDTHPRQRGRGMPWAGVVPYPRPRRLENPTDIQCRAPKLHLQCGHLPTSCISSPEIPPKAFPCQEDHAQINANCQETGYGDSSSAHVSVLPHQKLWPTSHCDKPIPDFGAASPELATSLLGPSQLKLLGFRLSVYVTVRRVIYTDTPQASTASFAITLMLLW
ncbi:hypothetical protein B0T21DRAFT_347817 [Apiosordaria backusii]|uniref:Uncharacterized protein n=1 Tax=Apiosordaria backusii TaxID=314023 RepID=A0AA40BNG3_9PEZI|nr:hypothetical protein B0T21DRAFT_347817 [Apiosordaria backusii]